VTAQLPRLEEIRSLTALATALDCHAQELERFQQLAHQRRCFKRFQVAKKGQRRKGEFRLLYAFKGRLKVIQYAIRELLEHAAGTFPEYVQGFVHRRSIRTNAALHLNQPLVAHADLRNFFDTVEVGQVERVIAALGAPPDIAATLARLCTVEGHLPQGACTSPVLANLVLAPLDADLAALGARYSRYADDLTFSGPAVPTREDIEAAVRRHGFELRLYRVEKAGRAFVTGLYVGDPEGPRVSRRYKDRWRRVVHDCAREGIAEYFRGFHDPAADAPFDDFLAWQVRRVDGALAWIASIESPDDRRGHPLRVEWEAVKRAGRPAAGSTGGQRPGPPGSSSDAGS
jgi:hypothetical protein